MPVEIHWRVNWTKMEQYLYRDRHQRNRTVLRNRKQKYVYQSYEKPRS